MPLAFRSVHPDFRSSRGYVWPFPGQTAEAPGPFTDTPDRGCPSHQGDGICLALTHAGAASGGIPAITVLVCEYDEADLLGTERGGSKIRVRKAKVLRVVDFPATLRGATPRDEDIPANLDGADLSYANLSGANLSGADLPGADLRSANLRSANLYNANLDGANLPGANLSYANLRSANLRSANLYGANLRSANLYNANLYNANLDGANLPGANLDGANLSGANLSGADLPGADLDGADLSYANLYGARGDSYTRLPAGYTVSPSGLIVKS